MREQWVICDLDGTLCDLHHRLHFLKGDANKECHSRQDPDWDGFNRAAVDDPPASELITLLDMAAETGRRIVLMTGRNAKYKDITLEWLKKNNVRHHILMMRPLGDYRSDVLVKQDLYNKFRSWQPESEVLFVLEDRDKVVEMWRTLGLRCLQVQKGEY